MYCLKNGYKSLVRCRENNEINDKYINCALSSSLSSFSSTSSSSSSSSTSSSSSSPDIRVASYSLSPVITFQILMAVFGGLAYWGVQSHRESSMTQFDSRRYRQRYSHIQTV